jgi:hypothetical protein
MLPARFGMIAITAALASACVSPAAHQTSQTVHVHIGMAHCDFRAAEWYVTFDDFEWSETPRQLALGPDISGDIIEVVTGTRPQTTPSLEIALTENGHPTLLLTSNDGGAAGQWSVTADQPLGEIGRSRMGGWQAHEHGPDRGWFMTLIVDNRSTLERALRLHNETRRSSGSVPECLRRT